MAKQTFTVGQVLTAAQMTSLQQTAMLGGSATAKTTSYTLVAADAGTVVAVNSTSATTITVNTGLFSAGDIVTIQNWGSGSVTITAGTATVNTAGSLIVPQYDGGVLYFTSSSAAIYYDFVQAGAVSPLTTKGDLYTFSSSDTRLAVGTNGQYLSADSTSATGLKWVTAAGGGKVLQVVQATTTTATSISAQTYQDTGLSASITPSSASSKILVLISQMFEVNRTATTEVGHVVRIVKGSTAIFDPDTYDTKQASGFIKKAGGSADMQMRGYVAYHYQDSPNTTSSTTYKTQGKTMGSNTVTYQESDSISSIILMEIGA